VNQVAQWPTAPSEPPIDPEFPIIDAHHHLWNVLGYNPLPPFTGEIFESMIREAGHNVSATVYIQAPHSLRTDGPEHLRVLGETEYADAIGARYQESHSKICRGIVGSADLRMPNPLLDELLRLQIQTAPRRFRGIRQNLAWDADPNLQIRSQNIASGMAFDEAMQSGVRLLGDFGLSYDTWLYHTQLPELEVLASACPDTQIIVDHAGGPLGIGPYAGHGEEVFASWKTNIARVARHQNIFVKLGGLFMGTAGFSIARERDSPLSAELARLAEPYFNHVIDCFGTERCMFESNFPMDLMSCSYGSLWNSYKRIVAGFSDNERCDLFFNNANRVYRLDVHRVELQRSRSAEGEAERQRPNRR